MKKTVLTCGLISGAISSLMMVVTIPLIDRINPDRAEIFGYTTLILSFLLIYVGVRSYRENNGGTITFGRALAVGLLITLISCVCYVATWETLFFNFDFMHQFIDKYAVYQIEKVKASGASQEALEAQLRELRRFKELYENPLYNAAITFTEPFPVGLVISLISAAVLRKKSPAPSGNAQPATS
jgi:hypothetical protein